MQWLQDPSQSNVDNMNNLRHESSRHFRNKKKEYLKAKIDEHETNSKMKNVKDLYRDINDFKKGYHARTNTVKDEKGDLFTKSHSILARRRIHFFQLFNVCGVSNVRQTEIHTAESLVNEPCAFEVGTITEKIKRHKSQCTAPKPAELIKAGVQKFALRSVHLLILYGKEETPE
jgi:hypothetical protein